jgi:CheY-like chemotaxis protein
MSQGRILVVEDIPDVRATICGIIEDAGYITCPAVSREEALNVLETTHIHVAILDIRLDESDEDNQDGILLMREISDKYPSVATIMLTGYANVETISAALQPNRQGTAPAFSFLKKEDIMEVPDYIQRAFKSRIKLNESLTIIDEQSYIEQMAEKVRFSTPPIPNKTIIVEEIQEIFGKLFFDCEKIQVYPIQQGFSGAIIFRVDPWYQKKGQGESVVVKMGNTKAIQSEERNYRTLVEGMIGGNRVPQAVKVAHIRYLSGILYTFIGLDYIQDFASFYRNASIKDLEIAVDNLYQKTWFPWQHKKGLYKSGFDLKKFYLEHLNLYPKKLKALEQEYKNNKSLFSFDKDTLIFEKHKSINPLIYIREANLHSNCFFSTIHGDLTGHNVMVDHHLETWLIDFATTNNQGHLLQDFASLENYIRLLMIQLEDLSLFYFWEKFLFKGNLIELSLHSDTIYNQEFKKASHVIQRIRQRAKETKYYTNRAYLTGLLFNALRTSTFQNLPNSTRDHAFLSAAIIAERLKGGANEQ